MLRAKCFNKSLKSSLSFFRTYLSNEYKIVLSEHLDTAINTLEPANLKRVENDINLFVNRLASEEINRRDTCEQFGKLRSTMEGTNVFNLTNHLVVKRFLESNRLDDLADIIKNRLYYRIFLDHYTGVYILNHLIEKKEYSAAAKIVIQFIQQEDFENEFVNVLSLKVLTDYIKSSSIDKVDEANTELETTEKKVRVKFLRNTAINANAEISLTNPAIGDALLKLSEYSPASLRISVRFLGLILCENYNICLEVLLKQANELHRDVYTFAETLIKDKDGTLVDAIKNAQEKCKQTDTFDNGLNEIIKKSYQQTNKKLINDQTNKYKQWAEESKFDLEKELEQEQKNMRIVNIEKELTDVLAKNKKLHFFELEDQLNLEIFKKKKYYPKKWFGTKKKPKVEDDDYVPPEVVKRLS